MAPNLTTSFLSFPTQPQLSPRSSVYLHTNSTQITSTTSPLRHLSFPNQRRRPTPIDLYALSTLEALPTPPSSSGQSYLSSIDQTLDGDRHKPRRLKKIPSQGELSGRIMRSFTKKKDKDKPKKEKKEKEKGKQSHNDTSFLPFDTDPPNSASTPASSSALRRPSASSSANANANTLPRPPAGMSSRSKSRPAPLDPAIFGHRLHIVRAEDPIDMVLRLDSEARVQAITRSFSPFGSDQPPPRPPPLDPSVFGSRQIKVERTEDPIDMVLRLDEEAKKRAMKESFTSFGDKQASRSRGQSVGQPDHSAQRGTEARAGSVRQRHHGAMPSIQGVIEGVELKTDRERRDSFKLPMMAPPPSANHLRRSPTSTSRFEHRATSPTASTPREYLYIRPESPRVNRNVVPGFTNRSPHSRNATIDVSPTLGSVHLPEVTTRQQSASQYTTHSNHTDYSEERLTALEILEELNGGMEEGWEFGVLDSQRIQAGLDNRNFKHYGLATAQSPSVISVGHQKDGSGSLKEVANSVRSWRESRKKNKDGRPMSEKSVKSNSKSGSIKPKVSYDTMKPLYEVHYSMEKDLMPPPIPPRAPGRSLPPLKLHIDRMTSGGSSMSADIPIVLDSPVKATGMRESMDMVRKHDIPESFILSPPTSPTPIHQRPLPPVPHASPHGKSKGSHLASLKQTDNFTRLLRHKRPDNVSSLSPHFHHSSPPTFTAPLSPLDSPPPSSPRPRLSAREEPHASLPARRDHSFSINRAESRRQGMTAISFLALEDPTQTWAKGTIGAGDRNSLDESRRRESVQAHIIPPEELAKIVNRRRASSDSEHSGLSMIPDYYTEELGREGEHIQKRGRMSYGLSPPPRHNRRSFEPTPRIEEEEVLPNSLSPPPRPRHSLSSRRPSDSPSTNSHQRFDHLRPSPAPSPFVTTLSPTQSYAQSQLSTPSPIKTSLDRDLGSLGHSPASETGHAEELRQGRHDSLSLSSPQKELDKQALNEWLSKPRVRKASVPVEGISRRRGMLV